MENKNYYELLEVDKNASKEVIEKAYKALVKKYHPDLQDENNKIIAEEKIKKINEAYEILSNEDKRKAYDSSLKNNYISKEDYDKLYYQNQELKNKVQHNNSFENAYRQNDLSYPKHINNNITPKKYFSNNNSIKNNKKNNKYYNQEKLYETKLNNAIKKAYYDTYIQDLKNRGYKIKYKKTFKDYIRIIVTLSFLIILGYILWKIPFIKNNIINFLNTNKIAKFIISFFKSFFEELSKFI